MRASSGSAGRLRGRSIVVTRHDEDDEPLSAMLEAEGAEVRRWVTLAFLPPEDRAAVARALGDGRAWDWIAFTSPRAVEAVTGGSATVGANAEGGRTRIAAVGERTAAALRARGWPVDLVGPGTGALDLARSMAGRVHGARVLFPAGSRAPDTLTRELEATAAQVTRIEAYRTVVRPPPAGELRRDETDPADVFTFASPSAVEGVASGMDGRLAERLGERPAVAIGPTTAAALQRHGVRRIVMAHQASLAGIVGAVVECL